MNIIASPSGPFPSPFLKKSKFPIQALTCEGYLILFSFYSLIAFILITERAVQNGFLESTVFLVQRF